MNIVGELLPNVRISSRDLREPPSVFHARWLGGAVGFRVSSFVFVSSSGREGALTRLMEGRGGCVRGTRSGGSRELDGVERSDVPQSSFSVRISGRNRMKLLGKCG